MRRALATFILLLAATGLPAGAGAMSAPAQGHCRVLQAEKLPAAAGGARAICAAIERAVAAQAPGARFSVEVKVVTPSMLAATLVVNGRALPEQKFAVMDRTVGEASIRRFANALAAEVAKAAKP